MNIGQVVGGMLTMSGAGKIASSQSKQGRQARERGIEQQAFNEIAAQQIRAIGQQAALEDYRQAELIASRAVAVAAAGGAVMDIDHLIADIYGEGAYRASISLHDAETQAEKLRFEGEQAAEYGAEVYEAKQREAKGTRMAAFGQVLGSSFSGGYGA